MSKKSRSFEAYQGRKCRSKKAYKTLIEAGIAMADLWLNHKNKLDVYECETCGKYHLTTPK